MEQVKPRELFCEPDPRVSGSHGLTIESLYADVERLKPHEGVPEGVRSCFNAAIMLWLYGYLYFPFFTHAVHMAHGAVEYALEEKFPTMRGQTLRPLLEHATRQGALSDEGYPSLQQQGERQRWFWQVVTALEAGSTIAEPAETQETHVKILTKSTPFLRNSEAHPKLDAIMLPGVALESFIVAAETINQLWARPGASDDGSRAVEAATQSS